MNLAQTKLTLDEWNSIEIPVSEKERQILKLIQKIVLQSVKGNLDEM